MHYNLQEERKEAARQQLEKEREEEEEAQVKQMRREMVHKAQPIRTFKPVELKTPAPSTEPMTPNLMSKQRATLRENKE